MSLYLKSENVEAGNRDSLLSALSSISDFDNDFNGANGLDYLWDEVWKANGFENQDAFEAHEPLNGMNMSDGLKYDSNLDWLLDDVKDIENDEECINQFFQTWMDHDGNYYDDYEVTCISHANGDVFVVSFAAHS